MSASRYRCRACGNLTRFDVTTTTRTRAFHHYTLGGELTVEQAETLAETVEDVSCRWCGNGDGVEELHDDLREEPHGAHEPHEPHEPQGELRQSGV